MRRCLVAERIGSGVAELRVQIRQVDFQRAVGMALMTAYGISEGFLQGGTVGLCLRQLVEAVLRGVQSVGDCPVSALKCRLPNSPWMLPSTALSKA